MKILLVHNTYQENGGEDIAFEQERQLLEHHGHHTITYVRSNREMEHYSGLQRVTLLKRIIFAEDSRNEVWEILQAEEPDLVHVHNTFLMVSPSIYEACREAAVPVLQTLHNYRLLCPAANLYRDGHVCEECCEHGLWRSVLHGCYRDSRTETAVVASMLQVHRQRQTWQESVSGYLAPTQFTRQKFIEGGLPGEKIYVKPHFVHPDPGERGAPGNSVLFAARLSQEKGIWTLLRAWERLRSSIPLVIVGDGPLRQQLEAEAARKNLRNVTFRGQFSVSETRAAIKRAAFLIVPSLCYETFSMSIVEAYACGTPVLCSRLGAMQENVVDRRTGLHFTPGDVEDLGQKIEWAWTHSAELAAMGREARREYETRYTPEKNYSLLMDIYQRTVNSYA